MIRTSNYLTVASADKFNTVSRLAQGQSAQPSSKKMITIKCYWNHKYNQMEQNIRKENDPLSSVIVRLKLGAFIYAYTDESFIVTKFHNKIICEN